MNVYKENVNRVKEEIIMNKQKSVGYVRRTSKGVDSSEAQRRLIQDYCANRGYDLVSCYEASDPISMEQIGRLEDYIRNQLGVDNGSVKLIPAALHHVGRSVETLQSAIIKLHEKHIDIEPVDLGEQGVSCEKVTALHTYANFFMQLNDNAENEYEIEAATHAVHLACDWDQSEERLQAIEEFVKEHYNPDLLLEENAALLTAMYLREAHQNPSTVDNVPSAASDRSGN